MERVSHQILIPLDSDDSPPSEIMLIPPGEIRGRDGRGPYRLDPEAVQQAFARAAIDLPIDFDHQTLDAGHKAGPVPAAGWIQGIDVRDGALWARVAWTPRAAELLRSREYRYISPVFRHHKGRIVALEGAGLTHYPNLHLPPVAHAMDDSLLDQIRLLLNLPTLATPEEVIAELQKLTERLRQAEEQVAQSRAPDPAEWVPMAQYQQVAQELATLQAEIAREHAEAAVEEAMAAGKLAPALKDWALAYAMKDLAGFETWARQAPVIVSAQSMSAPPSRSERLEDEEVWVAQQLGISPDAFLSHKRALEA